MAGGALRGHRNIGWVWEQACQSQTEGKGEQGEHPSEYVGWQRLLISLLWFPIHWLRLCRHGVDLSSNQKLLFSSDLNLQGSGEKQIQAVLVRAELILNLPSPVKRVVRRNKVKTSPAALVDQWLKASLWPVWLCVLNNFMQYGQVELMLLLLT